MRDRLSLDNLSDLIDELAGLHHGAQPYPPVTSTGLEYLHDARQGQVH